MKRPLKGPDEPASAWKMVAHGRWWRLRGRWWKWLMEREMGKGEFFQEEVTSLKTGWRWGLVKRYQG